MGVEGDADGSASSSGPSAAAQTLDDFLGGGGGGSGSGSGSNGRASGVAEGASNGRRNSSSSSTPGDLDLSALMLGGGGGGGGGFSFGGRAVRPLTIVTGDFGQKWMACSEERRAVGAGLSPGLGSPKAVAERLGARLGVHTVEIIPHTSEGICAGQLDGGSVCLVHCKV